MTNIDPGGIPDQPDGIEGDSYDLPTPSAAAERVSAYLAEAGDGLYDVCGGKPLYGRDLEALARAVEAHVAHNGHSDKAAPDVVTVELSGVSL